MLAKDAFSLQMMGSGTKQNPQITDSEYQYLLQNQGFANVDKTFNDIYMYCLSKTKKNERKEFISGWIRGFNYI
jgi:hypothetical protein